MFKNNPVNPKIEFILANLNVKILHKNYFRGEKSKNDQKSDDFHKKHTFELKNFAFFPERNYEISCISICPAQY